MDSETDTDTHSLCESEISRENYKSPESSDCEGYATPLASSLTDISNAVQHGITINVPDDNDDISLDSGERTPVSTHRAISPPIVKQIIYLQKPKILVMTQREILDESSEEEFYDVDDVQLRDVAQQLLDGVSNVESMEEEDVIGNREQRPDTPIDGFESKDEDSETTRIELEDMSTEDELSTPIETEEQNDVQNEEAVVLLENLNQDVVDTERVEDVAMEIVISTDSVQESVDEKPETLMVTEIIEELNGDSKNKLCSMEDELKRNDEETMNQSDETTDSSEMISDNNSIIEHVLLHENVPDVIRDDAPIAQLESCDPKFDDESVNCVIIECVHNTPTLEVPEKVDVPILIENDPQKLEQCEEDVNGTTHVDVTEENDVVAVMNNIIESVDIEENARNFKLVENDYESEAVSPVMSMEAMPNELEAKKMETETVQNLVTDRPDTLYELMPVDFSEILVAKTPVPEAIIEEPEISEETQLLCNQEILESDPMSALIIADEVKTSLITDNAFYNRSTPHEVKADFDGYSSGKEESLSSSTSSESFEFAEPDSANHVQDERTQALRNSIIERYPSNETDDDELDDVSDDFDEDLLAVKQISAEVEQLVAAINAFGRDEEQQMSAYLVGKKMAAEKKRKSAMDTGMAMTSTSHDQTVQTDNDLFILADRRIPIAMESLQTEIDKLQADLVLVKNGEKELLKINTKLKEELEESQQTIDGIEVEAEQQYTELTSEIDELCEIVQKKDQDLAVLKEEIAHLSVSESNLKDDVDSQRIIVQRQKEIIESLREDLDAITKKLSDVTKLRDKAIEEVTVYKMKNMERDRFLSREAQMSMEIEDLQRELNKQKLILNQTSMAKLADTFDRKVLHLENELRERDMLICKQNQIINNHRKSPTGSIITTRKMQPRTSVLAAAGNLPSAGSSSESFQHGLDTEAKEALFSYMLCDRHQQLANIYNIGRILDLTSQEERTLERHLTKDRFT